MIDARGWADEDSRSMSLEDFSQYELWLVEADVFYDAQRWNEAGSAYEHALALHPTGTADAWYRLGNVREEQGRDRDALDCFEKAVALEPRHARAWNNLAGARQRLGRPATVDAYRQAIAADPDLIQPLLNLGRLYSGRGEQALAAECFHAGLARHPQDATFAHLAAAADGRTTPCAPRDYVAAAFDGLAARFEHHLVVELGYCVPDLLAAAVAQALQPGARVLDLGCGTGLVGAALAGRGLDLHGVDLSPRMLDIARARGIYKDLQDRDLVDFLSAAAPRSAQAVLAADVFIYVGDLAPAFAGAARVLAPGGLFAFSVEALDVGDYRLMPAGHYAQSAHYLRALAARHGMIEQRLESIGLRREGEDFVRGWLAVFTAA